MKLSRISSATFFLCTILFCHVSDATSGWSLTLKNPASQESQSVRQTSDGGFIIGITANVRNQSNPGSKLVLVKTNSAGGIQWQKEYGPGRFIGVRQLKSGKYAAVAERPEHVGTGIDTSIIILMLTSEGTIEWKQTSPVGFGPTGIEEAADESLFIYGYSSKYNGSAFLIKLRSNGEMVWQKQFGRQIGTPCMFRINGSDTAFFAYPGSLHEYHIYKLNLDGKIIWKRFYKTSIFSASSFQSLQLTNDGGFIITEQLPLISKYDKNGKPVWIKFFNTATLAIVNSLVSDKHGNILLVGQIGTVNGQPDLWLLKLNSSGNILWHKRFGSTFVDRGSEVAMTKDNHFIIAGELGRGKSAGSNAWLLRLNQSGTLSNCNFAVNDIVSHIENPELIQLPAASELQKPVVSIEYASSSERDWSTTSDYGCK